MFRNKEEKKKTSCFSDKWLTWSLRHFYSFILRLFSESANQLKKVLQVQSLTNVFSVGYCKNTVKTTIYDSLIKFWIRQIQVMQRFLVVTACYTTTLEISAI